MENEIYCHPPLESSVLLNYINLEKQPNTTTHFRIALIVLNRPKTANALDEEVISCLDEKLELVKNDPTVRVLVLQGKGRHFCVGADLKLMREAVNLDAEDNLQGAFKLKKIFETISTFTVPTIAIVRGVNYGGGIGLIASCDFAIATHSARFCFTELSKGILPAVILPYVIPKIPSGHRARLILGAHPFKAMDAYNYGLVQIVVGVQELEETLRFELNRLVACGPFAQRTFKILEQEIRNNQHGIEESTAKALAQSRVGEEGQAGLNAHFLKQEAPWVCRIPNSNQLIVD